MTATVTLAAGVNYPDSDPSTFDALTVSNMVATALATGALSEASAAAGISLNHLLFTAGIGSATGEAGLGFGLTKAEGLQFKVLEELVDLTDAGALFVALTTEIPTGSVILCAQANIETTVVAGGTTVKVALGINDGDTDKYGVAGALTADTKINFIPAWTVLGAGEQIDVNGVTTAGTALGDTNISAGTVRVRIVYLEPISLADAA